MNFEDFDTTDSLILNNFTSKGMKKHYVDRDQLRLELIASNVKNQLTPKCIEMFELMVDNIQTKLPYIDPQDKEDCKYHAIEVILKNWKEYDVERPNPFAYFTRVIYNGLYAGWNEIKSKIKTHSYSRIFQESI